MAVHRGPGTLFVVATPIGNLEDFTFRALRILGEVELIAAEDTRRTAKLLAHYKVRRPLVSLREHNEVREAARLVGLLQAGKSIALVSDAGTPAIADPGARLVSAARQAGVPVVPVPGPSAVAAAVSVSGFALNEFVFMGFPPRSGVARADWFERVGADPRAVVFFEAPHRIRRTLQDGSSSWGIRQIMVIREMTKIHEAYVVRPSSGAFPEVSTPRGEFTIVLGPDFPRRKKDPDSAVLFEMFERLTKLAGIDERTAVAMSAAAFGVSEQGAAKLIKRAKISVKRATDSVP
jgi:16S rRNA (cytidine1402-2'-O)-methyltransferase